MRQGASNAEQVGTSLQPDSILDADLGSQSSAFSANDDPTSLGSRLFRGRARAGTLPSSWNNAANQPESFISPSGLNGTAGVIGESSNSKGGGRTWSQHIHQEVPSISTSEALGIDHVGSLRLSPANPSSAFFNYSSNPSSSTSLSSGRILSPQQMRSNSALDYDKAHHYQQSNPDASTSPIFAPPPTFSSNSATNPSSLQTNRHRSGSLASTLSGLGNNAFGPSIFTSTWADSSGQRRTPTTSSRQDHTYTSSSEKEQFVGGGGRGSRLTFDADIDHGLRLDEQTLDRSQDVHTLNYLGLEQDESGTLRSNFNPLGQPTRIRARTMASALPRNNASSQPSFASQDVLSSDPYRANDDGTNVNEVSADDLYAQYAIQHGLNASQVAALASAVGLQPPLSSSSNATVQTGRLRAGTVAAFGGPGGRQRLEQELRRMAAAGNLPDTGNGQGISSLMNSLQGLSIGSESRYSNAPLEGFPYLDINTPPVMTPNRSSPFLTSSPSTPLSAPSHGVAFGAVDDQAGWSSSSVKAVTTTSDTKGRSMNQLPSRSLWVGNLDSNTTGQELMRVFAPYGAIESLRLLPEKECGFVNFVDLNDAIQAREDVLGRLGGRLENYGTGAGGVVRIGYGKIDSASSHTSTKPAAGAANPGHSVEGAVGSSQGYENTVASLETGLSSTPMTPGVSEGNHPTRALWVGSVPSSVTPAILLSIFQPFGPVESARILTHKNCGFVNFERVDDAVRARKMLNGREILGSDVGAMRIGFAKVPLRNVEAFPSLGGPDGTGQYEAAIDTLELLKGARSVQRTAEQQFLSGDMDSYRSNLVLSLLSQKESEANPAFPTGAHNDLLVSHANKLASSSSSSIVPSSDKGGVPLPAHMAPRPSITDLQLLMSCLSAGQADVERDMASVADYRPLATYYMTIPLVSEVSSGRRFETSKLREIRRSIESGQLETRDVDAFAIEFLDSVVDLASDYIGNTLMQKFFEHCSEQVKTEMIQHLGPHLAMTGCHKNGTWAAQKILECSQSPEQIVLISQHLRPYIPGLLLDQFGNYVVQCCLRWQQPSNDFVFDAMIDRCWEIAQGRFGARSMRACLEKDNVTTQQKKRVAIAVVLNSVPLATNPNGSILLTWLLDTPGLSKSYLLLAPRFAPHLTHLCTHKLASTPILRIINQNFEPEASHVILRSLFESRQDLTLEEIVIDQVHGSQFVTKVLASPILTAEQHEQYSLQVRLIVERHRLVGVPAYRRLCEDLGLLAPSFSSPIGAGLGPSYPSYPSGQYSNNNNNNNNNNGLEKAFSAAPAMASHQSTLSIRGPQDAFNPYSDTSSGAFKYPNPYNRGT
ncbi:hypothetical protein CBS101457_006119 [Exobasidium rhododendri]|nr:hypothetical protein CBS101457_006119 [Exobasidium rhododendri]